MILGERRHSPVWAALEALIADYEDLQLDPDQVNVEIQDVCDQAHFLADMMLKYDWEDSKWAYQLEVAEQVNTLRQALDSRLNWSQKKAHLVSLRCYPFQEQTTLNKAHAAHPVECQVQSACTPSLNTLGSRKGTHTVLSGIMQHAEYF